MQQSVVAWEQFLQININFVLQIGGSNVMKISVFILSGDHRIEMRSPRPPILSTLLNLRAYSTAKYYKINSGT